jgi:UDP-GlcNAc:undecaprenyl-phosphate/decaprenyl-phosphate GlcNAc-1-phosphate transferase
MKALETHVPPGFCFSALRWLTPTLAGAAAGAAVLAVPPMRDLFQFQGLRWLSVLLFAFLGTAALTPLLVQAGHHWQFVDQPAERKIHVHPTPRLGGIAVYGGFVGSVLLNSILPDWMTAILAAGSLLLIIGVLDDLRELPASIKLFGQVAAASIVLASGQLLTLFPAGAAGDAANMLLTMLWIIGITNAFNFFDGMDGLATGLAILIAGFMGVVAYQTDQPGFAWLVLAIVGAGLGFLPYNFRGSRPAVIFLGDGGSTFLGFMLACLAVQGDWADWNPVVSFSNPLLIFGVLIYDMVHITVERIATGKVRSVKEWLDYVGKDHLHHRLERALGSRQASVAMIFLLTVCLGLAALALRRAGTTEAVLLVCQAGLIVAMVTLLEISGRRHQH